MVSSTPRALLSVYDKAGIVEFATGLSRAGWQLLASGGTAAALKSAGLSVTDLADYTGYPALLGHQVVTLHPRVHGGILADRSDPGHRAEMEQHGIEPIDLVVVDLYPFERRPGTENIDIGGTALIRAAAKNHRNVGVVTDRTDYQTVLQEIEQQGGLGASTRRTLARKAFARTATYDGTIVGWLDEGDETLHPPTLHLSLERAEELRYGENPHQASARYRRIGTLAGGSEDQAEWWDGVVRLGGMEPGYLNLLDAGAAWALVHDLGDLPAVAIIKHAGPCGVAAGKNLADTYTRALACDPQAAFGGVVAFNRRLDSETVRLMTQAPQADVVIAPDYEEGTVSELLRRRTNTRILQAPTPTDSGRELRQIEGGWLAQSAPSWAETDRRAWRVVSRRPPGSLTEEAGFAWAVVAHVASNGVVLAKDRTAWGVGAGQPDRVGAVALAVDKAGGRAEGGVCASDGFFPYTDGVEAAAEAGIKLVIQPGGSVNDQAVIEAADRLGLSMIFTGQRRFRH
ncbi:MAG: bifunctional phosphoribosylaminoimidazolecarboxamide formyltransferase/IMP cyclohydrolase [bacterium]|nr:bifunctional phosphoribosylaminoimidazolecarboxamide formyltransferase/IMP cyclohydrolase [bacterium]